MNLLLIALFTCLYTFAQTGKATLTNPLDNQGLSYIYDITALPEVLLEIAESDWNDLLFAYDANPDQNFYIPGDFTFTKDTATKFENVGLRLRGNSSRRRPEGDSGQYHNPNNPAWHQASFTVNFKKYDKDQLFFDEEKVNLKYVREDPTYIREVYCYDLYKRWGLYVAPFTSYCRMSIYIKGDPKPAYYGIYKLIEEVDDVFLGHRTQTFGDAKGYLWKARNGADFKNPDRSLMGVSDDDFDPIYDLKTHSKQVDEASDQLIDFIQNLITLEGDALKTWANETMDVNLFLKTYAANVMVGNWDDYWVNSNNFYFYFSKTEKQFFFIPYDFDAALGTSAIVEDSGRQDPLNWGGDNPLVRKLISIPEFRQMYIDALYELANPGKDLFYVTHSQSRIIIWRELVKNYIQNDTGDNEDFADTPAWWSNQQDYRLLSSPNNYFEIKVESLPAR